MLTFIDTNKLPRKQSEAGEATVVLDHDLCGAKNVVATLRWLKPGERFQAEPTNKHQLLYLLEGTGSITVDNKDYDVSKGAGVYLGPSESATVRPASNASLKLFHLVVPQVGR